MKLSLGNIAVPPPEALTLSVSVMRLPIDAPLQCAPNLVSESVIAENGTRIGHQHVSVDPATIPVGGTLETGEIKAVVLIGEKARLPIIAALDDMQRLTGNDDPW